MSPSEAAHACCTIAEERALVLAVQGGLPLVAHPYAAIAERLGMDEAKVISALHAMLARGAIRRIGVVPNHYAIGYRANAMSVWDVDDARVDGLGATVGALPFVTHCYRRPRRLPIWPYNLFAMVHGRDRVEVQQKLDVIAGVLGGACRAHDTLYSRRILKKTGVRLASRVAAATEG